MTWPSGTRRAAQMAPGALLPRFQSVPTAKISSTHTSFGSAMLSASAPPVDGRNPYCSTSDVMTRERLARGARSLQREHLRLLDGDDLLGDALDVGHVELAPLAARALGNRHLVLVDEGVAGVEIRVRARHLGDAADHLAVVAERPPAALVVAAVVDHPPVHRRQRAWRVHLARHDVNPALAARVRLRCDHGAVAGGQPARADDRAAVAFFGEGAAIAGTPGDRRSGCRDDGCLRERWQHAAQADNHACGTHQRDGKPGCGAGLSLIMVSPARSLHRRPRASAVPAGRFKNIPGSCLAGYSRHRRWRRRSLG